MKSKGIRYNDGSCREIRKCIECSGFTKYINKINYTSFYCFELFIMLKCKKEDESVQIILTQDILKNCPLLDYDDIRWHDMDDLPEKEEMVNIEISYKFDEFKDKHIATGCISREGLRWLADFYGIFYEVDEDIKLFRWRKI